MIEQLKETIKIIHKKIAREYPEVFKEINNQKIDKQIENEKKSRWVKLTSEQKELMIEYAVAIHQNKTMLTPLESVIKVINIDCDVTCIPSNLLQKRLALN